MKCKINDYAKKNQTLNLNFEIFFNNIGVKIKSKFEFKTLPFWEHYNFNQN